MSEHRTDLEFERKLQEIGAKHAHMLIPRSDNREPLSEFRFPDAPDEPTSESRPMSENSSAAVHFVTVTSNGEDTPPTVKFECRGDNDSTCHSYPDCECEFWDDEHDSDHPPAKHDECWMQGWFDADGICYEGPESYDMNDNCVPNGMDRSGEIEANYEYDGYVAWDFKEASL